MDRAGLEDLPGFCGLVLFSREIGMRHVAFEDRAIMLRVGAPGTRHMTFECTMTALACNLSWRVLGRSPLQSSYFR